MACFFVDFLCLEGSQEPWDLEEVGKKEEGTKKRALSFQRKKQRGKQRGKRSGKQSGKQRRFRTGIHYRRVFQGGRR